MAINVEYDMQKAVNLAELAYEYEIEQCRKSEPITQDRTRRLNALELDGLVKMKDYILDQDYEAYIINRDMIMHYKKLFATMVQKYKIFDTEKQIFANDLQYSVAPKARVAQITTKHQLREIVYEFNAQHRK